MHLARGQRYTLIQPRVLQLEMGDPQFQDLECWVLQDLEPCARVPPALSIRPRERTPALWGSGGRHVQEEHTRWRFERFIKNNSGDLPAFLELPLTKFGFAFYLELPPVAAERRKRKSSRQRDVREKELRRERRDQRVPVLPGPLLNRMLGGLPRNRSWVLCFPT